MAKGNKPRTLALSKSTPTSELLGKLFEEVEFLKQCPVHDTKHATRLMHNVSRIAAYIDKRWSH